MKLYNLCRALWTVFFVLCSPNLLGGMDSAYGGQLPASGVEGQALATAAEGSRGVSIFGFDADDVSVLKALSSSASDAALDEFRLGKGAFVSAKLAQQLSIIPSDLITLANPTGQSTPMGPTSLVIRYRVLGVVDSPLLPGADETVYVRRTEAEKFSKPAN